MTKKIETVVRSCADCKHSKEFQDMHSNCDFVLVCCYEEKDGARGKSILLDRSHNRIKSNKDVDIPKDCPLEDYYE